MNFEFLTVFRLSHGAHTDPEHGLCFMEAVAWLDGQHHTDNPAGVHGTYRNYAISLNDNFSDEQRQRLIPFLPRVLGTEDRHNLRIRDAAYMAYVKAAIQPILGHKINLNAPTWRMLKNQIRPTVKARWITFISDKEARAFRQLERLIGQGIPVNELVGACKELYGIPGFRAWEAGKGIGLENRGVEIMLFVFEAMLTVGTQVPSLTREMVKRAHQYYTEHGTNKVMVPELVRVE